MTKIDLTLRLGKDRKDKLRARAKKMYQKMAVLVCMAIDKQEEGFNKQDNL